MSVLEPGRQILGVPVHPLRMTDMLELVDAAIAARTRLHIGVVNAAKIVNMRRDALLRDAVLTSDVIVADGVSVVWAGRVLGQPLPERVAGIDLMTRILERAGSCGYRIYCLGATEAVLGATVTRIERDYPGAKVVGAQHGYFTSADEARVASAIADARPDVLFVAMTSPKKEQFLARWAAQIDVPVCHGVGGSFDVMAGKTERAPLVWQKLGLEWLYRVKQEPRRLWRRYLVTNTLFCAYVLHDLLIGPSALAGAPLAAGRVQGSRGKQ
jgi:N-acetylglucosaminyldiphosphoundecaprenol N-acetyl-beta-D-mannosaminyltransferase